MGDLVSDHDADVSEFLFLGKSFAVKDPSQDACGDIDGVVQRIVVGVDVLGSRDPLCAVDRLVDFVMHPEAVILGDGNAGIDKAAAFLRPFEIKDTLPVFPYKDFFVCIRSGDGLQGDFHFLCVIRSRDADGQVVQLFESFIFGVFRKKFLAFQHSVVIFDTFVDQICDITLCLFCDVSLRVDFAQLHLEDVVDSVAGGLAVVDLAGGAGQDVADLHHSVVAVAVQEIHELQDIGDQEIGLHFLQIPVSIEAVHPLEPGGLLKDEDF